MTALETNILARYLLNDDARQGKVALTLLSSSDEFTAPVSVLLELVWVLEVNDCTRDEILRGLRHILGLSNFKIKETEAVVYALRWYEAGMDFGDALHLSLSARDERFATFDKSMEKAARKVGVFPPVHLKK